MKVTASFSAPVDSGSQIMYIPEGTHDINPTVDGKPGSVISKVPAERGEEIAATLNKSLEKRKAKNVRAHFDFDHSAVGGPASALPQSFSYVQGRGIMVDVKWTNAGEEAVKGGDYGYLSPVYLMSKNTGEPIGLPSSGPIGALVNDPAFRETELIAAKRAEAELKANSHKPTETEMDNTVLISAGVITDNEAKTDNVAAIVAAKFKTIQVQADKVEGLESKVVKLEASLKAGSEAVVDQLIKAAVTAGGIAPKDEDSEATWRGLLTSAHGDDDQFAKVSALLAALKPAGDDITTQIVGITANENSGDSQSRRDKALVEAAKVNPKAGFVERFDKARELDPEAFKD
jgi:phage I-like protein